MDNCIGRGRARGRGIGRGLKLNNVSDTFLNKVAKIDQKKDKICSEQFEDKVGDILTASNNLNNTKPQISLKDSHSNDNKLSTKIDIQSLKSALPVNQIKVLAKYNYKANSNSPGGFTELSITQREELVFLSENIQQPHWWFVENSKNQKGYAPSSYLMKLEAKVTSLPWLDSNEKKKNEPQPSLQASGLIKYKSAYNKKGNVQNFKSQNEPENWNCEICEKTLNGPVPYNMHMKSKAHKEELELAKLYGRA